jgi:hypothetical protein
MHLPVQGHESGPGQYSFSGTVAEAVPESCNDFILALVATGYRDVAAFASHRRAAGITANPRRHAEAAARTQHRQVATAIFRGAADFAARVVVETGQGVSNSMEIVDDFRLRESQLA